jgi:EmrB/QacA subfamily drug resistance transporter
MGRWGALAVLATAQLLLVLDTAVMNVSIGTLVEDLDTDVVAIQGVITTYSLVMAALMVTGGKLGDRWGRRRAFSIGLAVYAVGSALTAAAPDIRVLLLGWSVLEGAGAALALPSLVALVAGSYRGRDRATAYGVLGAAAGVGVAVGPILGGWVTTALSWRLVFVGEVVLVLAILASVRLLREPPGPPRRPDLDVVGAVLSAIGLALIVLAALQASTWGWLQPRSSPVTPLGFALTPFVFAAGGVVLACFVGWQRRREAAGQDPLVRLSLFSNPALRSGLATGLAQNVLLLGLFFTLPLYLQLVLGMDAFRTGIRLLPVSIALLLASLAGAGLATRFGPRTVVRTGLVTILVATLGVLSVIGPDLAGVAFALTMGLLGTGMGLVASQLGNVVQSSVDDTARSEAGGLQFTAQNLGAALGTALIGALVLGSLTATLATTIATDERLEPALREAAVVRVSSGIAFVDTDTVRELLDGTDLPADQVSALVEDYAAAQLAGLRSALLGVAALALGALAVTRRLPRTVDTTAVAPQPERPPDPMASTEPPTRV